MADKAPAFQFYPMDFLTDERVRGLKLEEVGLYTLLLCHAWLEGSIPDDPAQLSRICGVDLRQLRRIYSKVRCLFEPHLSEPGRLVNPRQERERQKLQQFTDSRRRAAGVRWGMHVQSTCNAHAMQVQCSSSSSSLSPPTPSYDAVPAWERFQEQYPGQIIPDRDCQMFLSVILGPEDEAHLLKTLPAWLDSRQFREGFAPSAKRFLEERWWKTLPKDADPEQDWRGPVYEGPK